MSRTVIDLDDDALAAAQARLGTTTKVQTVNEALRRAAALPSQHAAARTITALLATSDVESRDVMAGAWRSLPALPQAEREREP